MFFPELSNQPLQRLQELFVSDEAGRIDPEDKEIWLQEVALSIAEKGDQGLTFLLDAIPGTDEHRLRAILLGFSFLAPAVAEARMGEIKQILLGFLESDHALLVARAIDSLNRLGVDVLKEVNALLGHPSPYVVGSVLRYLSRHDPEQAKPILLKSLRAPDPIVRQNAIDELDSLECGEALEPIRSLVNDPDKYVRQAAQTAVENLEEAGFKDSNGVLAQPAGEIRRSSER